MSEHPPSENGAAKSSSTDSEKYVDFNQFLLQHNFAGSAPAAAESCDMINYFGYFPSQVPLMPMQNMFYNGFDPQMIPSLTEYQRDLAMSSNLLPTAAEFIPRFSNLELSDPAVRDPVLPGTVASQCISEGNDSATLEAPTDGQNNNEEKISQRNHTGAINKSYGRGRHNGHDRLGGGRNSDSRYYQNGNYSNRNRQNYERNLKRHENHWKSRGEFLENRRENGNSDSKLSNKIEPSAKSNAIPIISEDDAAFNEKLSQREKLIREIEGRRLECLVCVEPIKVHQSVWSCDSCYTIIHLNCVVKWASSSKSEDGWRCPACQKVTKQVPRDYYCFCSKVKNPQYNRSDVAHSCGEVCGRKTNCDHPCTLLCHPGRCPPCQANVTRMCGCGRSSKVMQCYIKDDIECEATCGKLNNCGLHNCKKTCHKGDCPKCEHEVTQNCYCSKQNRKVACTKESNEKKTYSCGKACNRDLACGNHKCKDVCHSGECKPCKLTPAVVTSCPCGKMPIASGQRQNCLQPIPTCSGICGKTLKCGQPGSPHRCISKCHTGNCPPCNKQTTVKCRCGHMDQMIKCRQLSSRADDARCKKRCTKKRTCGRHKCNQECCIDIDHICPQICNFSLSCGKHKCDRPCHRGNCPPCYRSSFEELYCECRAQVIYPPVPCGTKRPPCTKPCSRQHPCDHPVQHNCHSAPVCPPCMIFTTKYCHGAHEQRKTIPCSQTSFSCGMPCGKKLSCGRHKCIKTCHEGPCQSDGEICKQNCTTPRMICSHKCNAPCHEKDCPDTPCKEMVEVSCECGNRKQMRSCQDISSEYRRIATAQLASSMIEMQRGNMIELSDIMGPIKMTNNKTLECNEECKVLERNRRLAIALQSTRNPEVPSSKILTRYSDNIKGWAKKDPNLVKTIHDALTTLVKLAKESPQRSRSHSFPTMNRDKRSLVHEMCSMFGVESVAYDAEPNRNVVATAHKDRCWLPAMSIMEVMQRESGQRRVPVPSNNAWGLKR